jgi:hypothetical protein
LEGVVAAQEEGCLVALTHPAGAGVDADLRRTADLVEEIPASDLETFLGGADR